MNGTFLKIKLISKSELLVQSTSYPGELSDLKMVVSVNFYKLKKNLLAGTTVVNLKKTLHLVACL